MTETTLIWLFIVGLMIVLIVDEARMVLATGNFAYG
jgi:hypothetical protein